MKKFTVKLFWKNINNLFGFTSFFSYLCPMKLCGEKKCAECPFSKASLAGWLADYTVSDLLMYMQFEIPFPCHMAMPNHDISVNQIEAKVLSGELPLCRGYMEMMKKSCKLPKKEWLAELLKTITLDENSVNSMEFYNHHSKI